MSIIGGIAGGAIGAIGQVKSQKIAAETARYNTDRTIRGNMELAEYSYGKDLEMWKMQNEYNSPQAQMQRLQEAGLNPRLMYGSGTNATIAAGQAKEMPKYQAPRIDYAYKPTRDPGAMLTSFFDIAAKSAQVDILEEQVKQAKRQNDIGDLTKIDEVMRLQDLSREQGNKADVSWYDNVIKAYQRSIEQGLFEEGATKDGFYRDSPQYKARKRELESTQFDYKKKQADARIAEKSAELMEKYGIQNFSVPIGVIGGGAASIGGRLIGSRSTRAAKTAAKMAEQGKLIKVLRAIIRKGL